MALILISFWYDILLCIGALIGLLYAWSLYRFSYWEKKGVPGLRPTFIVGNMKDMMMGRKNIGEQFVKIYKETKSLPYAGVYMMNRATLVVNDLDLIRNILVKDFSHFTDHSLKMNEKYEPLSVHLFNATGDFWKSMRTKMTPAFTSSKMKYMFHTMADCGKMMEKYLEDSVCNDESMDLKEVMAKFNTDVIGSCAFGIECNSFKNPDAPFRKMGKRLFDRSLSQAMLEFLIVFVPSVINIVKMSILGKEVNDFFFNTVKNTIKHREENNIVRNDFMQLLMQLRKDGVIDNDDAGSNDETVNDGVRLTTMQVTAQVFVFFIAGFETSSSTASFALYEMSLNPDIQDKVREEIDKVIAKHDNKITYDALGEMTYLQKVIDETLRKYPPLPLLFRVCTKNYVIPGTDITIEKDTPIMIPILGIQRDPQFFPEPEKFDPERFTPENKAARHHFSYLPFGEGPRVCIGSRFGLMQVKLGLVSVLSKYELSVCEKTSIPMVFEKKAVLMIAEGGVWLKLKKRSQ